jgi:hypothetical protein
LTPCDTPRIGTVPAQTAVPRLRVEIDSVEVTITNSIVGAVQTTENATFTIADSIVDAQSPVEVAYAGLDSAGPGATLTVTNSTIIGKLHAGQISQASNTLFVAELATVDSWAYPVVADQSQQGCVRFSYVPRGSQVPRAYRCHPSADDTVPVAPAFTSLKFGDPGYCQLAPQSGLAILQGAEDQSEMGVFHDVHEPQRLANLGTSLKEYLRFGLQAGIFYAS